VRAVLLKGELAIDFETAGVTAGETVLARFMTGLAKYAAGVLIEVGEVRD
jgi:hypothetical protein